jgi:DsbC/DsbD-like thiol-disulfide interchange protein
LEHVRLSAYLEAPIFPGKTPEWRSVRSSIPVGVASYWRIGATPGSRDWPTGVWAGEILWLNPEQLGDDTVTNYGYTKAVTLLLPLTADASAKFGVAWLTVHLLACERMCILQQATLDLDMRKPSGGTACITGLFTMSIDVIV